MNEEAFIHKQKLIEIAKEAGIYWEDKGKHAMMIDNYLFTFDADGKLIDIDER